MYTVFRYREYSEDLETIEEIVPRYYDVEDTCSKEFASKCKHKTEYLNWLRHQPLYIQETDKRNDDQVESNEKFAVEFKTGAEYLQWLKLQLPYVEPFLPKDDTHYYFFRKWRKDDLKYYSEMEYLNEMENEDGENEIETDIFDPNFSELKPTNEETKPEFDSGRQLVEWLGRRLEYLEPFAPIDAVHFYFKRRWSREKFVASLDAFEERETVEETNEEVLFPVAPHIEPNQSSTEDEEDINVYICLMSRPMVLDGLKFEKQTQEHVQDKHLGGDVNEHVVMESTIKNEMFAAGPQIKPLKKESNSGEKRKIKKQQKKKHSFLLRLFGR